jgi:hypothetical protein
MSFKQIILAAANIVRITSPEGITRELTLVDAMHFGKNMQAIMDAFEVMGCKVEPMVRYPDMGQGFIDNTGKYFDRTDSYHIANNSGQPMNKYYLLGEDSLDSSCIRHFPDTKAIVDFCYREQTE